ncbi:hypothetical protein Tco_1447995 [Tanacetum coccineum]
MLFLRAEEDKFNTTRVKNSLSPLLEEYYNPAHGHAEDNNNDQALNASFQETKFINPFGTRVKQDDILPIDPKECMFSAHDELHQLNRQKSRN